MQPEMPTYRTNAVAAGIFFIIATVFLFFGEPLYDPVLSAPDVIERAATSQDRAAAGLLIEFVCVLAIPLVAISLYPVLRRVSATLAVGYVAFRLFEAAIFAQLEIERFFVLSMSEAYRETPDADAATLTVIAEALTGGDAWSGVSGPLYNLVFVTGMLMLNAMLWRSRLVPRFIAAWGIVSGLVLAGIALTAVFTTVRPAVAVPLIAPLAVQEMVLAVWFIVRGFDSGALAALPD